MDVPSSAAGRGARRACAARATVSRRARWWSSACAGSGRSAARHRRRLHPDAVHRLCRGARCRAPAAAAPSASVDVLVPDMGNFTEVGVIEVLVKPGDSVEVDTPLVTLETEKATMDVPSTAAGRSSRIHVQKGGRFPPGHAVVTLSGARSQPADGCSPPVRQPRPPPAAAPRCRPAAPAAWLPPRRPRSGLPPIERSRIQHGARRPVGAQSWRANWASTSAA